MHGFDSILALAHSMGMVLAAWALLTLLHVGLGTFVLLPFGGALRREGSLFRAFWTGWAGTLVLLIIWNFFLSVDWLALAFVACGGMAGLLWNWRGLRDALAVAVRAERRLGLLLAGMAVLALFWANQSIDKMSCYDSGLYHFTCVEWAKHYPAVPGLGNLNGRFAHNQSPFLYLAMLDWGPLTEHSRNVLNGLLLFVCSAQGLWSLARLLGRQSRNAEAHLFRVLLTAAVLIYAARFRYASSPSPDIAMLVVGVVLASAFVEFALAESPGETAESGTVFFIALLASAAVTVKLSLAVFAGPVALCAAFLVVRRRRLANWRRTVVVSVLTVAIAASAWVARGIILSGWPLFPTPVAGVPVEWRVPRQEAADTMTDFVQWSRWRDTNVTPAGDWSWLEPWSGRLTKSFHLMLVSGPTAAFLVLGGAAVLLARRRGRWPASEFWVVALPALAFAVVWFLVAPDLRFAGAVFWIPAAAACLALLRSLAEPSARSAAQTVVLLLCGVLVAAVYGMQPERLFVPPGPEKGFYPVPKVALIETRTRAGMLLYVPAKDDQCWIAPLPCAPAPRPDVRLRVPGDLAAGFVADLPRAEAERR